MISIEKMKDSVGKNVKIIFTGGEAVQGFVESYEYDIDADEEPMILVNNNYAFKQSEIQSIEIQRN